VPGIARVVVLSNQANPTAQIQLDEVREAAEVLGLTLHPLAVRRPDDFEGALEAARREGADALLTLGDAMLSGNASQITALAARYHLPAMYSEVDYPPAGGLMAYAPSNPALSRRAAAYVDRILKGAKPADLPVEQPTTFDFIINLQTAQALGLTIPRQVLLQATEMIQ
jgi:ABC-type uncharacterized transport system substrate-binding protein